MINLINNKNLKKNNNIMKMLNKYHKIIKQILIRINNKHYSFKKLIQVILNLAINQILQF